MAKVRINKRKEYKEQLRLFITLSNNVRRKIRKHFKDYGDLAESLFDDIGEVPNEYYDDYYNDMLTILGASAREVIITMGNRLHRTRIIKKSDEIDPVIVDYVGTQTAQNVRNITETTRRDIQRQISLGLETGLSNPQISKNIRKSTGFSAKRATLIARTETHQAMNYGNQSVAKRLGLKKPVKEWASALDERARSWHVNMNGVQVGIDEPFKIMTPVSGGGVIEKQLQYAGDANGGATNVINCRCFVLYYDEEDLTTGEIGTRPSVIEGDDLIEKPEVPIVEFGDSTKEELMYHKASFNDSDRKFKRIPALFPALNRVLNDKKKGAYADDIQYLGKQPEINMPFNISKISDSDKYTWRHEYGHTIDYRATALLREKSNNKKIKDKIKNKRLEVFDSYRDGQSDQISDYYYKDILEDRKNFKNKFIGQDNYFQTKFKKDYDDIFKKYNIEKDFDMAENILTKEFVEDMIQDGKMFTKADFVEVMGKDFSKNINKTIDELVKLGYGKKELTNSFANRLFKYRVNNKNGVFGKLNFGAFEDLSDLAMTTKRVSKAVKYDQEAFHAFSDFIGGGTNNFAGAGHTDEYFARFDELFYDSRTDSVSLTTGNTAEMFAQYYSLSSTKNNKFFMRKMGEFFPATKKGFDEVLDELTKLSS